MTSNPCTHINLVKVEEDNEKNESVFKCFDCGSLIPKDKLSCKLCGGLKVDDISEHLSQVHGFDLNRWDAVTGLGT